MGLPIDLVFRKDYFCAIAELKHYRNRHIPTNLLRDAVARLLGVPTGDNAKRVLVTSSLVPLTTKEFFQQQFGTVLWDRSNIANFISALDDEPLFEKFLQLLLAAQQGTDTSNPLEEIVSTSTKPEDYFALFPPVVPERIAVQNRGAILVGELAGILAGKPGWADYERKCTEILQYLFESDLAVWEKQQVTDDELSRFDLICRIVPRDDFWKSLIQAFNSRYVLFEFKNYSGLIPQSQIYTTERYLFPKALRSVAIVMSRKGATNHALTAAKGALREHGKLILLLSDADLQAMLEKRDAGGSPNDYLSEKLDEFLLSLSR